MAGLTLVTSITTGINMLISAANAYFSGERARPEIKKKSLCKQLVKLRGNLKAIAETGEGIGELLNTETFSDENDPKLQELIKLLEDQNENIRSASREFGTLATLFEIKRPELHEIRFHLRGKSDHIDMIYAAVGTADLKRRLGETIETWETNELFDKPADLAASVNKGRSELHIRKPDDVDWDYEALVAAIEPLTAFIDECCDPHNLI